MSDTTLSALVVGLFQSIGGDSSAYVNIYVSGARRPTLEKVELPFSAFPYAPTIGDSFDLVLV